MLSNRLTEKFCTALSHSFPGRLNDYIEILFFNFSFRPKPRPGDPL